MLEKEELTLIKMLSITEKVYTIHPPIFCSVAPYKLFYSTGGQKVEILSLLFVPPAEGGGMEIKMVMNFDIFTLKGNLYKKLIQRLCQISDRIYFTSDREYLLSEGISELNGKCEMIQVPVNIRQWCSGDVIGYKIDFPIIQYLYAYDNLNELLGDRMSEENKTIFFYKQDKQIVHIYNAIQNTMYIVTDDEKIIRDFFLWVMV